MKSSPSIWCYYVVSVKSTVKILSIFVAFLKNMNFKKQICTKEFLLLQTGQITSNRNVTNLLTKARENVF